MSSQPARVPTRAWGRVVTGSLLVLVAAPALVVSVLAQGDGQPLMGTPLATLEIPSWVRAVAVAAVLAGAGLAVEGWFHQDDVAPDDEDGADGTSSSRG